MNTLFDAFNKAKPKPKPKPKPVIIYETRQIVQKVYEPMYLKGHYTTGGNTQSDILGSGLYK